MPLHEQDVLQKCFLCIYLHVIHIFSAKGSFSYYCEILAYYVPLTDYCVFGFE